MANTRVSSDGITVTSAPVIKKADVPRVRITLPLAEDGDSLKADQTEQVIINGEITNIRRGTPVDVTVPVFILLKQRYPLI